MTHAVLTRGLRLGLALIVLVMSGAPPARAQEGGGPPSELTVADMQQALEFFQHLNRSRAMVGLEPLGAEQALTLQILKADFDENIMPGLMFAEQDCFIAEVPLANSLRWLRQVELLGLDQDWGPLWEEAAVVHDSVHKILVNCHKQLYERCLLDDGDPNAALLPSITKSLNRFDDDPIYAERTRRCEKGWTGFLKIRETLNGNLTQTFANAESRLVVDGTHNVDIDLLNKQDGSVGTASGRVNEVMVQIGHLGRCTTTMEQTSLKQSRGSGDATLRKVADASGAVTLIFAGPRETGSQNTSGSMRVQDPVCGPNSTFPNANSPIPPFPWPGQISLTLGDPYTEVISGDRTLVWIINSAGAPTLAREGDDGGARRVPAIPGFPGGAPPGMPNIGDLGDLGELGDLGDLGDMTATPALALAPWTSLNNAMPDADGERPIIRMEIEWNLVFGG